MLLVNFQNVSKRYITDTILTDVSFPGNFTDFWYARQRSMPRAVGRVTTRRKHREKQQRPQKMPDMTLRALEQRIAEAEEKKMKLERRIADAFEHNDQRDGR